MRRRTLATLAGVAALAAWIFADPPTAGFDGRTLVLLILTGAFALQIGRETQ